ncbi:MAG: TerD family protein, partial [Lachnospiraceae bacterium]|nr:TerD family protein [Lachnospiraceae bacterium]
ASADAVAACMKDSGSVLQLQLLTQYETYEAFGNRTFTFTHLELLRSHTETDEEKGRRRSYVPQEKRTELTRALREELAARWKGKLGKVYVSEELKKTALPVSESSAQGGFGVLPKGTRLPLPEGKKLRAFTYWEKVNDIDLSVIGLDAQNRQHEFSWRTMASNQSGAITYSGDQTSGYNGGSEFFDIDLPLFRETHPEIRYMIFCNNVYTSGVGFDGCVCTAGYMLRDTEDSGEVFDPKTVLSSYTINCPASYAFLFALDLERNEFVWLNAAVNSSAPVAGDTNVTVLNRLFKATDIMSLYDLLVLQASSLTDDPAEADVVATDKEVEAREDALRIHSYDIDVMLRLIETK